MELTTPANSVSAAIQSAIAPVFLLTGIGAILSVVTTRFGRVVDRMRRIEARMPQVASEIHKDRLLAEMNDLWRRIKIINWAMRLSVSSALLICVVIIRLFIGTFAPFDLSTVLASLFVLAMLLLVLALLLFLMEVAISSVKMLQSAEYLITEDEK
ncbi:MAG: DUF2721 domain-containing protein [Gammaproteobacteria bacterium]|nr:DUF2721 domain-containing protein [Gammaproteobacteria bacterium]MDH4313328.1 DUF2721 domain-containing protein [Gammaproteobacteria bacterium]MDH5501336.1 DUF2721 domain-containing protein [Gammaproteobacteria bacterium]